MKGSITKRCGCRDTSGQQLGASCPKLRQSKHGYWGVRLELPARQDGSRRRFIRGGYERKDDAKEDLRAVEALLALPDKADTAGMLRIADLLEAVASTGEALPDYSETRNKFLIGQPLTTHLTVADWLSQWIESKRALRDSSKERYMVNIRCHLIPRIGGIRLDRLTVPQIAEMFADIRETNEEIRDTNHARRVALAKLKETPRKGVENRQQRKALKEAISEMPPFRRETGLATQHNIKRTLRAALNTAMGHRLISFNPAKHVELPTADYPQALVWTDERVAEWLRTGKKPSPVMVWTPEQAGAFLDFIAEDRLYALFHLITFRGLRRGEACALCWSDRDRLNRSLKVAKQLVQIGWKVQESKPKTGSGDRTITLDRYTDEVLEAHERRQLREREAWESAWQDTGVGRMFTAENGAMLHPGVLSDHFRELVEASGLPPIRLHDLRHVAASLMLAAGIDEKVVSETLGHRSSWFTKDFYQSVMPQLAVEAAEATAAMVPRGASRAAAQPSALTADGRSGITSASHPGAKIIAFPTAKVRN